MNKRQCVCVFTSDELIEKFHHFLHNIIATSIQVIKTIPDDTFISIETSASSLIEHVPARLWQIEHKEKLLIALVKVFSLNMPLYVTYKHLLFNHGRYNRIKECSCSSLTTDSLTLLYLYCQTNSAINGALNAGNNSSGSSSRANQVEMIKTLFF